MTQNIREYHPIIISINYADNSKQYACINYGVFELDSNETIKGIKISKQIVLVRIQIKFTVNFRLMDNHLKFVKSLE